MSQPSVSRYGDGGMRPDFVLLGIPAPAGVELWASTELSYAELEAEVRHSDVYWDDPRDAFPIETSRTFTLRAGLRKFVVVRAPSYREALAHLLAQPGWEPGGPGQQAIGPPPR